MPRSYLYPIKSRRGRRGGGFRFLRGALGAGGTFPSGEFVGVAAVFVLDGGIKAGDDGLGLAEEGLDGGGTFDAFEVVAVFAGVAVVQRIAVGAEVGDEVGGDFVGDEVGAQRGFGGELGRGVSVLVLQQTQQEIRVGGDGDLDGGGDRGRRDRVRGGVRRRGCRGRCPRHFARALAFAPRPWISRG